MRVKALVIYVRKELTFLIQYEDIIEIIL